MSTIKDIAQKAGVSIGTVSNYFNNPDLLNPQTFERIKQAVEQLNYHPHYAARALKSHQTRKIGIIPVISAEENKHQGSSDYVFFDFLSAVNTAAAERGYGVLLETVLSEIDETEKYIQLIGEKQIDGFVLLGTRLDDSRVGLLLDQKFPFVTFGRTSRQSEHPWVDVDGAQGISKAIDYLVSIGHQRIALITPPSSLYCAQARLKSFHRSMQMHHLPIDGDLIIEGDFTEEAGIQMMNTLLQLKRVPTALLAPNDISAFGLMKAMQLNSLKPGRDISIVGFDNIPLAYYWQPSLTTIAQPIRQIGYMVANILMNMLEGVPGLSQKLIEPELIVRESTSSI